MEVTAFHIQISVMEVFVFLLTQPTPSYSVQKSAFPIISPDRLQFFEYESLLVKCGGDKDHNSWKVMRKFYTKTPANESQPCSIPAPSCTIPHTFEKHSGEYWCENDEGERGHVLIISVTAGLVILNIPAQPVKEGSDVTLHCAKRNSKKAHNNDFYKNGSYLGTYYETSMTLSKVSKADEGLYKCKISAAGESPESWLAVVQPIEEEGSHEEKQPLTDLPLALIMTVCTIFTLILLVIGLIFYKKHQALKKETVTDSKDITYAVVNKSRKRNGGESGNKQDDITYAAIDIKKTGSKISTPTVGGYSPEQQSTYSVIALKRAELN